MIQICIILNDKEWKISLVKYIRDEKAIRLIGKRIREIRKKQKLSQSQLAYEANIPRMQVSRIERGEVNTSISTLLAIARVFEIHVKELFNF
jgi:DNA-binding XRE family transcriptional regulator